MARQSGILLHITALPSNYGIGDFGPGAYAFADFLKKSKQKIWQVLPLNTTTPKSRNSPYSVVSTFALNGLLISPEKLVESGLLSKADIEPGTGLAADRVNYISVIRYKKKLLRLAYENFKAKKENENNAFVNFCKENDFWLDDYCLFVNLKDKFGGNTWLDWPDSIKNRDKQSLDESKKQLADEIGFSKFIQFAAYEQYFAIKKYCNDNGIKIFGDIPIYVDLQSSDVWANPDIFKLGKDKRPHFMAGVPPDYFSKTGQLWKNPVYNWEYLHEHNYCWWTERIKHNLKLFDYLRIDHFIGFVKYWEVPAGERTAVNGKYAKSYGVEFLKKIKKTIPDLPIIAEDLGVITQEVIDARKELGFSGMRVLMFAFGDDYPQSVHLPINYTNDSVVYTGTHDNNTLKGWFLNEARDKDKKRLSLYADKDINETNVNWEMIRMAALSVADMMIIPMQDILCLGPEARFNLPSTTRKNWEWRLTTELITKDIEHRLSTITEISGR